MALDATRSVYAARAIRDFGDGFVAVILPVYLTALGLSAFEVGVVATLALAGSALLTLGIGFLGARHDHRRLLLAASLLMAATGLAYAAADAAWVLFVVAFVGTVNPSGGSASLFVPIEHTVLSGAVAPAGRTGAFARYSLIGALAGALGSLVAAAPDWVEPLGVARMDALKALFLAYAALGIAGGLVYRRLPAQRAAGGPPPAPLGPSRRVVYRMALLFSLDSFAAASDSSNRVNSHSASSDCTVNPPAKESRLKSSAIR